VPAEHPQVTRPVDDRGRDEVERLERTMRMTPGICEIPIATAALPRLAPRMAARPTASIRNGKASSRSVNREMRESAARK
jgi:hypothetical protein